MPYGVIQAEYRMSTAWIPEQYRMDPGNEDENNMPAIITMSMSEFHLTLCINLSVNNEKNHF